MIDSGSGKPFTVVADAVMSSIEEMEADILIKPSLLQRHPSRSEKLTTADLMQQTSLVTSNHENKIYGFYYLV